METRNAARYTADAILDAQKSFPSKHRMQAVREYCTGTDYRITALEAQVKTLQASLDKMRDDLVYFAPEFFDT